MLRLHYIPTSAAMAAHAALAEAGADYELALVERDENEESPPEYKKLNPSGRVPTLEDGDLVITESAAVVLHVGDRFPDSGLNPPVGTPERSLLYRRLIFMTNTLQATLMRWFYPGRYTTDPAGAEALQARAAEEIRVIYDQLERDLEGREWIVGDSRTGADLYLFMLTRWGRFQEPAAWDRPNLRAHFLRSLELPGVRRMIEEQKLDLPDFAPG